MQLKRLRESNPTRSVTNENDIEKHLSYCKMNHWSLLRQ